MTLQGLLALILLFELIYLLKKERLHSLSLIYQILVATVAILIAKHMFDGFVNFQVLNQIQIEPTSTKMSLFLSFDKGVVGFLLLGIIPICHSIQDWKKVLKGILIYLPIAIFIMLILVWILGYVKWSVKFPSFLWIWSLANLFLVSISEETIFRGFIQKRLVDLFGNHILSKIGAIIIASVLFGFVLHPGSVIYKALATIAGIIYGISYPDYPKNRNSDWSALFI
ncbi:MAG: hypothetical protein K940chlam8_00010 [Chlamydiae bacterium]|nr:hypothetical protein [Chlamydiota bacterium]